MLLSTVLSLSRCGLPLPLSNTTTPRTVQLASSSGGRCHCSPRVVCVQAAPIPPELSFHPAHARGVTARRARRTVSWVWEQAGGEGASHSPSHAVNHGRAPASRSHAAAALSHAAAVVPQSPRAQAHLLPSCVAHQALEWQERKARISRERPTGVEKGASHDTPNSSL